MVQDQLSRENISRVGLAGDSLYPRDGIQAFFGAADVLDDQIHMVTTGFTSYEAGLHCLVQ